MPGSHVCRSACPQNAPLRVFARFVAQPHPDVRRLVAPRLLLHPSAPCIQMPAHADPPPVLLASAPDALVQADFCPPAVLACAPLAQMRWCGQIFAPQHSLHVLLWHSRRGGGSGTLTTAQSSRRGSGAWPWTQDAFHPRLARGGGNTSMVHRAAARTLMLVLLHGVGAHRKRTQGA